MGTTRIEWTQKVWNILGGCSRVSPGCDHCYAERMTNRLALNPATPRYHGLAKCGRFTGEVRLFQDQLSVPLKWRKPSMIFVQSMGDLSTHRCRSSLSPPSSE